METGFYYLNSRYYDPKVGRFLNADGILGANGGITGYNLFAYCNNNPVMGYDPSGESWLPYSGLSYPGEIHNAVLHHIVANYTQFDLHMEVYIRNFSLRADLVDGYHGVYELKPVTWRCVDKLILTKRQLDRYITAFGEDYHPGAKIINGSFLYREFYVNYWTEPGGLIYYKFEYASDAKRSTQHAFVPAVAPSKKRARKSVPQPATSPAAGAALIVGLAIAGAAMSGGGGGAMGTTYEIFAA